jgi:hypothetical protein
MSFVAAAVVGGALITGKANKDAAKTAAGATPKFNPLLVDPIKQQLGRVGDTTRNTFGGDRIANLTPDQLAGLQLTQGLAGDLTQQAGTSAAGFEQFASGANVGNNPHLEQAIAALRETGFRDLSRNQLPAIRNNAVASGGLGGSRQGIAEGLALSDLNRDLTNTEARMRQGQFNQDLTQQLQALIQQGAILGNQTRPQDTLLRAGGIQQSQDQAEIGGAIAGFNEAETAQFDRDQALLALLLGTPQSQPVIPGQTNPLVAGLGAGITTQQLLTPTAVNPTAANPNQFPLAFGPGVSPEGNFVGGTF